MYFRLVSMYSTTSTVIHTLSLHDALPILVAHVLFVEARLFGARTPQVGRPEARTVRREDLVDQQRRAVSGDAAEFEFRRSEEHTSELQSLRHLVCRLLLEKKKIS